MRRILVLSMVCVLCFNLCACGTNNVSSDEPEETTQAEAEAFKEGTIPLDEKGANKSSLPFKAADYYECVKTDTPIHDSGITYTEIIDDMIYVTIQQRDPEKKRDYYEYCTFDMLEEKWTDIKTCVWSEKLSELGWGQLFHRDTDGSWYCCLLPDPETEERDCICKLGDDGMVEKIVLPEEVWGGEKEGRILNYEFIGDGKIMILLQKPAEDKFVAAVEVYRTCLMDVKTREYEIRQISKDIVIPMLIGDEFFCTSYTEESCGFLVRKKDSEQPVRELRCEPFLTGTDRCTPYFKFPQSCQDDGDNVYIMYDDGIYGGYYKDKKLRPILEENMAPFLKLSEAGKRMAPVVMSFCRGTDTKYADFYVLIAEAAGRIASQPDFNYELVHIKAEE